MARSRSRDRDRRRGRSSSRERRRARSRSRDRNRERDRHANRDQDTHKSTKHRHRSRSASPGRNRDHYAAGDSETKRKRDENDKKEGHQDASKLREESEENKKKARLERLAAWKQQQQQQEQQQQQPAESAPEEPAEQPNEHVAKQSDQAANVWLPWEDPSTAYGNSIPTVPREILERQAKAAAKLAEEKAREIVEAADVDPLDAFMAAEILPEVKQKEQAEAAKKEEERIRLAKQLAEGKVPKLDEILEDSDEEPEPDAVMEVPLKKVKLVVGPGGEKIRLIEKKSKARLQIVKEEDELNKAFGSGPAKPVLPKPASGEEHGQKMTKIMIFGNANQCEIAQRMIEEAIDNKEQKAKQRQKEYEKKRDAKARDRQLYHMRHTRDYETLELPIGASRVEVKAAYRKLAKVWHPDKHPNNQEEAKERFQKIQMAYDSLMLTEEDARIEALGN